MSQHPPTNLPHLSWKMIKTRIKETMETKTETESTKENNSTNEESQKDDPLEGKQDRGKEEGN